MSLLKHDPDRKQPSYQKREVDLVSKELATKYDKVMYRQSSNIPLNESNRYNLK